MVHDAFNNKSGHLLKKLHPQVVFCNEQFRPWVCVFFLKIHLMYLMEEDFLTHFHFRMIFLK